MDQTAHNLQQQTELYGEPLGELVRRVVGPLGLTQGGVAQVIGMSAPMLSQLMSAQRVKIGNPAVVSRLKALDDLAHLAMIGEVAEYDIAAELDAIRGTTGAFTRSDTAHLPRAGTGAPGEAGRATGEVAGAAGQVAGPGSQVAGAGGAAGQVAGAGGAGGQAGGAAGQIAGVGGAGGQAGAGSAAGAAFATPPTLGIGVQPQAGHSVAAPAVSAVGEPSARAVVREIQDLLRAVASADEIQRAAAAIAGDSPALAELLLAYGTGRTADALAHYDHHHG
ncbi:hypothetical protein [Kribbella sp. NPDC050470]|uniref:hypothetical protein n=1 Tax=unclassified Kribbella TaxID=2644121 RepID=UPI0037B4A273